MEAYMTGREYITPEKFYKMLDYYACVMDFDFKTKYSEEHCKPGHYQGDCKECWDSKIVGVKNEI